MHDDLEMKKMFNSVEGTTLMDMDLPATKFVIKDVKKFGTFRPHRVRRCI